jgi:hypothetical protein
MRQIYLAKIFSHQISRALDRFREIINLIIEIYGSNKSYEERLFELVKYLEKQTKIV